MAVHLTRIYTKTGDDGTTALGDMSRVAKTDVRLAAYADVRRAGSIGRSVFWPAPNVDSALVGFTRREPPPGDRRATFAVVDAAFAQRRKTLRAALAGWAGSAPEAERRLREAGIDPSARGEVLGVTDFARLAAVPPVTAT